MEKEASAEAEVAEAPVVETVQASEQPSRRPQAHFADVFDEQRAETISQLLESENSEEVIVSEKEEAEQEAAPEEKEKAEESKEQDEEKKAEESNEKQGDEKADSPNDPISKRFAALARREASISERERSLKDLEKKYTSIIQEQEEAKKDPDKWLAYGGWDYNKATQYKVNDNKPTKEMVEEDAINNLKKLSQRLDDFEKSAETREVQSKIDAVKENISGAISSDSEKYELTSRFSSTDEVYEVMRTHYNNTGAVMTIDEALDLTEKYYENKLAESLKGTKKLSRYFTQENTQGKNSVNEDQSGQDEPKPTKKSPINKTLTNRGVSYSPPQAPEAAKSDREILEDLERQLRFIK